MVLVQPLDRLEDEYRELVQRQQSELVQTGTMPSPVLVLLSLEVDSLCAAKMLTGLLRSDNVQYTLKSVASHEQLVQHVKDTIAKDENVISIFLINCGGGSRLVSELSLQSRVVIYLLDSHRPYALANVHSEQVRVLHDSLDQGRVEYPEESDDDDDDDAANDSEEAEMEEVRRHDTQSDEDDLAEEDDEEDEEDDYRDEDGEPSPKRRKRQEKEERRRVRDEARAEARRQRREGTLAERRRREREREIKVRQYYSGTSFGCATAVLMYEVCNQLRKVSNHDLWLSILGLTDQFVHERVAPGQYAALQAHISGESIRLGNETRSQSEEALLARAQSMGQRALDAVVTKVGHIGDINDYRIPLLRHGTLYHALKHAPYVLARLETWTEGGKSKLRTLLTELGIATSDARQLFKVLSPESKNRLDASLEAKASDARYNLPDIRFKSFSRQVSPSLNFAAQDAVLALSALMELPHHDAKERYADWTREQGFWRAWAAADSGAASGAGGSSSSGSAASSASSSSSTSAAQAAATHSSSSSAPKVSGGGDATPNALLLRGVEQSMHLQKLVLDTVSWCLASKAVKPGGDFRYAVLPESADSIFLSRPAALQRLALALSEATKVARGSLMPLVLASPLPGGQGAHLVVAVLGSTLSPEVRSKNPFGLRFATAAVPDLPEFEEGEDDADEDDEARRIRLVEQADMTELARLRVTQEGFDSAHVEVKSEDLNTFIERLTIQGI